MASAKKRGAPFARRDECAASGDRDEVLSSSKTFEPVLWASPELCTETFATTRRGHVQADHEPQSKVQVQSKTERFLWFPPPVSQSQQEKEEKHEREKDSASNTTTNSSAATATETGATTKRVRLNDTACVCNGVDAEELEIVARIMKWPSFHTTQHNLSKEKVKQVLDKMVVLCGVINSKIVSNGNYESGKHSRTLNVHRVSPVKRATIEADDLMS